MQRQQVAQLGRAVEVVAARLQPRVVGVARCGAGESERVTTCALTVVEVAAVDEGAAVLEELVNERLRLRGVAGSMRAWEARVGGGAGGGQWCMGGE
eukprot:4697136-Prymnesium_polylepis.1